MHGSVYFGPQVVPGEEEFQTENYAVENYLAVWNATKSRLVIPVCDPD